MDKEFIKKFISTYASQAIINRALAIYNSDALSLKKLDTKNKIAKYRVKGTKLYNILIKHYDNEYLNIKCDCPYDWSSLCKHGLAALYHLEKHHKKNIIVHKMYNANELIYRNPSDPVEIFDAENITSNTLEKYHVSSNAKHSYYKFIIHQIKENRIEINAYSNYLQDCKIYISKQKSKYYLHSDLKKYSREYLKPHLYSPEYNLLNEIKLYNPSFLVKIFDKKKLDKTIDKVTEEYGLKNRKKTTEYFNFYYDLKETIKYETKDKYSGLIPVKPSFAKNEFDEFISEIIKPKKVKNIEKYKQKEFVLGFMVFSEIDNNDITNITILRGSLAKKNKNELVKIKAYEIWEKEKCEVTKNQNQIIDRIKNINKNSYENKEDLEIYLIELKKIFTLLKNETFVYFHTGKNGWNAYDSRVYKNDLTRISIPTNNTLYSKLKIEKEEDFINAKPIFYTKEKKISIPSKLKEQSSFCTFLLKNQLYVADTLSVYGLYTKFLESTLFMPKEYEEEFIEKYIIPLSQKFNIEFDEELKYILKKEYLEPEKKQVFLEEEEDFLIITPQIKYSNDIEAKLIEKQDLYKKNKYEITQYVRDIEYEDDYLDLLATLHPNFEEQKEEGIFYIPIEEMTKDMWFFNFFDKLKSNKIDIFGLKELKKFKYSPHKATINTSISSGEDWFDVDVNVSFGNQHLSLKDIRQAIKNKDKFIKLNDDSVGILPEEWLEKMTQYFKHGEINGGQLKVSKMKFSIIDELFEDIDQEEILEEIYKKKQLLKQFKKIDKVKVPKEIKATLREYQKEGLNWLNFLNKMKWGGILADDMGLGKTIQIIAFLQSIKKKSKLPNLIVVPTSLMFNWENELKKFAPSMLPYFYYGTNRSKEKTIFKENNLIITTYGIMTKDIEFISKQNFHYIVLDESQAIKNPNSQRYKASILLKAKNKLTLTGTPIENNTFDLYAQMNFVNPGFFGTMKSFKDNYAMPIDKDGDKDAAEELQKLISPFLLRRTKEQVATELPPKTEDILYCQMPPKQQKIYDAYKNEYRNKILNKIETDGLNKSKLFVLAALTKLRQICDSPMLLKDKHIDTTDSAKIKLLLEHINEKTANHKILIFSQFTSMLALIREELNKINVLYEYLDGKSSIKNRQKSVGNFQKNAKIRVFLISLKAGGTGLNLTEADYVYIVDPWWNPAVENQAIDRCYRIGQNKSVMAYRMICKGTIEEKIVKLQNKKKQLASDIIQTDEKIMKTIDKNSLMDLFS